MKTVVMCLLASSLQPLLVGRQTTTIGMLTGMIPVTSGVAFVGGKNVEVDMTRIRKTLGVCPQHDILFPTLTVREHLRMYAVIKGVPAKDLSNVIRATLADVGLTEKENELTKTLSGGQKRKLSVGIALIGGSRVVFLDEPTSGMDPHRYARRRKGLPRSGGIGEAEGSFYSSQKGVCFPCFGAFMSFVVLYGKYVLQL